MKRYDVIVVGAGHNGLVLAAYLAKAGINVLVLEREATAGGSLGNFEIRPGFVGFSGAHIVSNFSAQVARDLALSSFGLEFIPVPGRASLGIGGPYIASSNNARFSLDEIKRHSHRDADSYEAYSLDLKRQINVLRPLLNPALSTGSRQNHKRQSRVPRQLARAFDGLDDLGAFQAMRLLVDSCAAYLGQYFESDIVKAHIGAPTFPGSALGPMSAGSASLLAKSPLPTSPIGLSGFVKGGVSRFVAALRAAVTENGGSIKFQSEVADINLDGKSAVGVTLTDGTTFESRLVVSNLDPKRSFLTLFDWKSLPQSFVKRIGTYRLRGALAKMDIALDGLPRFPTLPGDCVALGGQLFFADNLLDLEKAFDDWSDGIVPPRPLLEVVIPSLTDRSLAPSGKHVMSIYIQYVPSVLFDGIWDASRREKLAHSVINQLSDFSPRLQDLVLDWTLSTSVDFETDFSLTNGDSNHGELSLDQMLFNRPLPDLAANDGPIQNFLLCGAGLGPGGGVTGMPGALAAQRIIEDSGRWRDA